MLLLPRTLLQRRVAWVLGLLAASSAATVMILTLAQGVGHASTCSIATNTWTAGAGSWDTAANWSAGHVPTGTEYVCINATGGGTVTASGTDVAGSLEAQTPLVISGTLTLNDIAQPSTLTTATLTGTLAGAANVTVTDSMSWTRGVMSGSGTTQVASGAVLNVATTSYAYLQSGRTLANAGTVHWSGSSYAWFLWPTTQFVNSGQLLIDSAVTGSVSGTAGVLVNTAAGTVTKSAGSGTGAADLYWAVQNQGALSAAAGMVRLRGGDAGTAATGLFAGVEFNNGTWTLGQGATTSGAISVVSATVTATGTNPKTVDSFTLAGGTWTENGTLTVTGAYSHTSGTLGGTGTVVLAGTGTWSAGVMSGSGTTQVASGATLALSPSSSALNVTADRTLENNGTTTLTGAGISAGADVKIVNHGTWTIPTGASISDASAGGVTPRVVNTGAWVQTSGSGSCACSYLNSGTLRVDGGTYTLSNTLENYDSTQQTLTGGTYLLPSASQLRIAGLDVQSLRATVSLTGSGSLADSSGLNGLRNLATIWDSGGLTLAGGATVTVPAALANRGTVTVSGPSTLTVTGSYAQGAGTTSLVDTASHLAAGGGVQLNAGTLAGIGTVDAALTNSGGCIAPAGTGTTGTLTVTGAFTQSSLGVLAIDVTAAGADQLAVGTSAALGGELALVTDAAYSPATGATRTPLTYGTRTGFFTPVTGAALGPAGLWWLSDPGTHLDITVQPTSMSQFATLTINGGAARTTSRSVTLTPTASAGVTVSGIRLGNDTTPTGSFQVFAASLPWTLGPADGTRLVKVQLRDDLGNLSQVASASIVLDTTVPTVTITHTAGATATVAFSFSEPITGVTATNMVLRVNGTSSNLAATLACFDATGASVSCATGEIKSATLTPTGALLPGVTYAATVNPAGAPSLVRDLAGNAVATTTSTFTV
jgi:hypothetical protein